MHEKILIIQTAFLGDAILTLPLVQYLRSKNEKNIIDVVCIPSTEEIFSSSPFVNKSIVIDKREKQKSFLSFLSFTKELKKNNYTKVISPHRSFRTSLMVLLLNVKDTVGFDKSSMSFVYKKKIKHNWNDHEVLRNLKLADYSSSDWKILPKLIPSEKNKQVVKEIIHREKLERFVILAPGSVWFTKAYPVEQYAEIANQLAENGFEIVLIGGKSEIELCVTLENMIQQKSINLAGRLSIIESVELMRNAKLLISNDSAPTHMGMAADIPVLTLYCSTIPGFGFYPYNNRSKFLSYDDLKCKPCGIHGRNECPLKTFECAVKLTSKSIVETALKMIS